MIQREIQKQTSSLFSKLCQSWKKGLFDWKKENYQTISRLILTSGDYDFQKNQEIESILNHRFYYLNGNLLDENGLNVGSFLRKMKKNGRINKNMEKIFVSEKKLKNQFPHLTIYDVCLLKNFKQCQIIGEQFQKRLLQYPLCYQKLKISKIHKKLLSPIMSYHSLLNLSQEYFTKKSVENYEEFTSQNLSDLLKMVYLKKVIDGNVYKIDFYLGMLVSDVQRSFELMKMDKYTRRKNNMFQNTEMKLKYILSKIYQRQQNIPLQLQNASICQIFTFDVIYYMLLPLINDIKQSCSKEGKGEYLMDGGKLKTISSLKKLKNIKKFLSWFECLEIYMNILWQQEELWIFDSSKQLVKIGQNEKINEDLLRQQIGDECFLELKNDLKEVSKYSLSFVQFLTTSPAIVDTIFDQFNYFVKGYPLNQKKRLIGSLSEGVIVQINSFKNQLFSQKISQKQSEESFEFLKTMLIQMKKNLYPLSIEPLSLPLSFAQVLDLSQIQKIIHKFYSIITGRKEKENEILTVIEDNFRNSNLLVTDAVQTFQWKQSLPKFFITYFYSKQNEIFSEQYQYAANSLISEKEMKFANSLQNLLNQIQQKSEKFIYSKNFLKNILRLHPQILNQKQLFEGLQEQAKYFFDLRNRIKKLYLKKIENN